MGSWIIHRTLFHLDNGGYGLQPAYSIVVISYKQTKAVNAQIEEVQSQSTHIKHCAILL